MIKANELRMWNWVNQNGEPAKIYQIEHRYKDVFRINDYVVQDIVVTDDFFTPIPLTPEILEKCGFSYNTSEGISSFDDFKEEGDTHYWELPAKRNEHSDGFTFCIVKWGDGGFTFSSNLLRVNLNHLHQLQNLYFALTGEELEVAL